MILKKAILYLLLLILAVSNIYSIDLIPVRGYDDRTVFSSPALLAAEKDRDIPFGIELKGYADMDMLNFISNPATVLADAAVYLKDFLLDQDDQYLIDNFDAIKQIFQFDAGFPAKLEGDSENLYNVKWYLEERFDQLGAGNRARAVSNALNSELGIYPEDTSSLVAGDLDFSLRMYGGQFRNGFGWNVNMGIVYDGASSILSSISYKDHKYGSDLYFMLGGDVGYGSYISDSFAIGLSFSPDFVFRTTISNSALLSSRISGKFLELLGANSFDFGMGLNLNLGFMIDAGDAKILIDFRNIPSMQMYWYFDANDILYGFKFHEDEKIYFVPPDASVGVVWDHESWHIKGEISNIADQLMLMSMLPTYKFDILSVPKFSVGYSILENMIISLGYEYRKVILGFEWEGLNVEFSTKVDKFGFGITLGYEF